MAKTRRKGARPLPRDDRAPGPRRGGPLRDHYPAIFAFGEGPIEYLTVEAAKAATPHDRIRSVWPFLVKRALKFCETLRNRPSINFDPEDVLTELYGLLLEKDAKWEPERGSYLTFVGRVVTNELHQIRDRAGTIHGPRNAACRLKQYEAEHREGTLSEKKTETLRDIRRAFADHESLDPEAAEAMIAGRIEPDDEEPAPVPGHVSRVRAAVAALPPGEFAVVSRLFGLLDGRSRDILAIAEELNQPPDVVKRLKIRGLRRLQSRLSQPA